jgi:hypothetical protein
MTRGEASSGQADVLGSEPAQKRRQQRAQDSGSRDIAGDYEMRHASVQCLRYAED